MTLIMFTNMVAMILTPPPPPLRLNVEKNWHPPFRHFSISHTVSIHYWQVSFLMTWHVAQRYLRISCNSADAWCHHILSSLFPRVAIVKHSCISHSLSTQHWQILQPPKNTNTNENTNTNTKNALSHRLRAPAWPLATALSSDNLPK